MPPAARHSASFAVAADHPSLPGHFPGRPVVPGVLVLEQVLQATEVWLHRPVSPAALRHAKFVAPLLPGEEAHVDLELVARELRFRVTRAARSIAVGVFVIDAAGEP